MGRLVEETEIDFLKRAWLVIVYLLNLVALRAGPPWIYSIRDKRVFRGKGNEMEDEIIREITKDGKTFVYNGKIEGNTIYKQGEDYYTYKNGKLRKSEHVKSVVKRGW